MMTTKKNYLLYYVYIYKKFWQTLFKNSNALTPPFSPLPDHNTSPSHLIINYYYTPRVFLYIAFVSSQSLSFPALIQIQIEKKKTTKKGPVNKRKYTSIKSI